MERDLLDGEQHEDEDEDVGDGMRNGLVQHALCARRAVLSLGFLREVNDPLRGLVTEQVEIVQVLGHVFVLALGCTDRVARLAVFAELAGVGIGLQTCILLGCPWCATV